MCLSKLPEMVKDREAWHAAVHGVAKSQIRLNDWTTTGALHPAFSWKEMKDFIVISSSFSLFFLRLEADSLDHVPREQWNHSLAVCYLKAWVSFTVGKVGWELREPNLHHWGCQQDRDLSPCLLSWTRSIKEAEPRFFPPGHSFYTMPTDSIFKSRISAG